MSHCETGGVSVTRVRGRGIRKKTPIARRRCSWRHSSSRPTPSASRISTLSARETQTSGGTSRDSSPPTRRPAIYLIASLLRCMHRQSSAGNRSPGPRPFSRGVDRALHASAKARRRRHGHRLGRRAARAGPPTRGPQADQAGHGLGPGAPPVRGRAAGAGPDGPPEHRQGVRRRHDARGPAVLRDGARQGRADHEVLRRPEPAASASGSTCSCRSAGRSSTPTRRA